MNNYSKSVEIDVSNIIFLGTFESGLITCNDCPLCTYNNLSGATSCVKCLPGFIANYTGSSSCQCSAGKLYKIFQHVKMKQFYKVHLTIPQLYSAKLANTVFLGQ